MARSNRILAIDIGAASVKVGAFEYTGDDTVVLVGYDYREYGEILKEETRTVTIAGVLRDILDTNNFAAREAMLCISGQFALTRFVGLPPVAEEENRVRQIVEFEARQNVPFPMEEVIWDYQLIANPEADELEVMFVVIKNEIVEQITNAVQEVGLSPIVVDVAPCACYNSARANGIGDDECAMILDLGGRSTNLLFADRQQFFTRTIPIAGHTITQQIAKEFGIGIEEAEELKRRHGFVALGGAYEEPESEVAGAVSKIVRNVMTRLHGEINRSIGVYRAQQKGNSPTRLYLTGGSSIMGYTDKFFTDKLDIPVSYLNPFQVVQVSPKLNMEHLQEVAHMFSQVIGLGLRRCRQQPVEVSLVPAAIARQMVLRRKKPYLLACAATLLLILGLSVVAQMRKKHLYEDLYQQMSGRRERLEKLQVSIRNETRTTKKLLADYDALEHRILLREEWPEVLNEIEMLIPDYVWLTELKPVVRGAEMGDMPRQDERPERIPLFGFRPGAGPPMEEEARPQKAAEVRLREEVISVVEIHGHSLSVLSTASVPKEAVEDENEPLETPTPEAETTEVRGEAPSAERDETPEQIFLTRLKQSEMFDDGATSITSYRANNQVPNLKTFSMKLRLKEPITIKYEK
ncbi:MAG: type IV pilus assembly protein PilM [Candidatus Pacebacteria bacterium]|nr:type IV pilus assembly protein PilM [Candidatus Paceibacterota bacterium]